MAGTYRLESKVPLIHQPKYQSFYYIRLDNWYVFGQVGFNGKGAFCVVLYIITLDYTHVIVAMYMQIVNIIAMLRVKL